jgi:hypothetical protein
MYMWASTTMYHVRIWEKTSKQEQLPSWHQMLVCMFWDGSYFIHNAALRIDCKIKGLN